MISATSQHALRALVILARLPGGEMVLGKDLSVSGKIPANYLSQILLTLRKAGFLDAIRGSGGGYQLKKPANQITLIDVVELFEGISSRPACFLDHHRDCCDDNPCPAHSKYNKVRSAYLKFLETTSISVLAKSNSDLILA